MAHKLRGSLLTASTVLAVLLLDPAETVERQVGRGVAHHDFVAVAVVGAPLNTLGAALGAVLGFVVGEDGGGGHEDGGEEREELHDDVLEGWTRCCCAVECVLCSSAKRVLGGGSERNGTEKFACPSSEQFGKLLSWPASRSFC